MSRGVGGLGWGVWGEGEGLDAGTGRAYGGRVQRERFGGKERSLGDFSM